MSPTLNLNIRLVWMYQIPFQLAYCIRDNSDGAKSKLWKYRRGCLCKRYRGVWWCTDSILNFRMGLLATTLNHTCQVRCSNIESTLMHKEPEYNMRFFSSNLMVLLIHICQEFRCWNSLSQHLPLDCEF